MWFEQMLAKLGLKMEMDIFKIDNMNTKHKIHKSVISEILKFQFN